MKDRHCYKSIALSDPVFRDYGESVFFLRRASVRNRIYKQELRILSFFLIKLGMLLGFENQDVILFLHLSSMTVGVLSSQDHGGRGAPFFGWVARFGFCHLGDIYLQVHQKL